MQHENCEIMIPFLKWAGGKRWLRQQFPTVFPHTFKRYVEPFLGGGAVFFALNPQEAILSDLNSDLIATYKAIKADWRSVHAALRRHQQAHSTDHYYAERERKRRSPHEKAAQFLYLNRTCWNGLYRVNLEGRFNVPIGTKSSVLLPTDDFQSVSSALSRATLLNSDFETIIDRTREGDFLFVDPPYTVKHNVNGFIKYNEKIFSWADQERLALAIGRAGKRGAQILVTNADHKAVRDLYRSVGVLKKLSRYSVLAGDAVARGPTSELAVLVNYRAE